MGKTKTSNRAAGDPQRSVTIAVRITESELEEWEAEYLDCGQTRSEVVRKMLRLGKKRPSRPHISTAHAYDYERAMLIRLAAIEIDYTLRNVSQLDSSRVAPALDSAMVRIGELIGKICTEATDLQTQAGGFKEPATMYDPFEGDGDVR